MRGRASAPSGLRGHTMMRSISTISNCLRSRVCHLRQEGLVQAYSNGKAITHCTPRRRGCKQRLFPAASGRFPVRLTASSMQLLRFTCRYRRCFAIQCAGTCRCRPALRATGGRWISRTPRTTPSSCRRPHCRRRRRPDRRPSLPAPCAWRAVASLPPAAPPAPRASESAQVWEAAVR